MKWWIAVTAGVALILAGVSIWLGPGTEDLRADATNLSVACVALAEATGLLGMIYAVQRRWLRRGIALTILVILTQLMWLLHEMSGLATVIPGPFCMRSSIDHNLVCAQSAPLWVEIYYLAPIFILAIAALLSIFWPAKQNPVIVAGQTVWPPR